MKDNNDPDKDVRNGGSLPDQPQDDGSYYISPDSPDEAAQPETSVEVVAETRQARPPETDRELESLRKEKDEIYDRLLRKHADFENYRKRAEREKREFQAYALSDFMLELLQILDNFERALAHPDDQGGSEYRRGVELIHRQFRDLMEKRGLRAIETTGQPFDPNFHEAILREERNDLPENTILAELQKGYYFRDKLLRPAMVKVSYRSGEQESNPDIELIDVE